MSHTLRMLPGDDKDLLDYERQGIGRDRLHLPGPDFIERVLVPSDRPAGTLVSLRRLFNHGRLSGTGYLSILPVDQGIEHSAGASFAPNPDYNSGRDRRTIAGDENG